MSTPLRRDRGYATARDDVRNRPRGRRRRGQRERSGDRRRGHPAGRTREDGRRERRRCPPLAAALSDDLDLEGEHVGIIISGGNVNLTEHAELTRTGLHELERYTEARLALAGWPTSVGAVVETVEAEGSELDVLERARRTAVDYPNRTPVTIGLEGSGPGHLEGTRSAVGARGVSRGAHARVTTNGAGCSVALRTSGTAY